jgi:hypothetical protein
MPGGGFVTRDTGAMPVEETMWDIVVARDVETRHCEQLRAALAEMIATRLPSHKRLLRVVQWSAEGGSLFRPKPGTRRFAVAYEVEFAY